MISFLRLWQVLVLNLKFKTVLKYILQSIDFQSNSNKNSKIKFVLIFVFDVFELHLPVWWHKRLGHQN